MGRGEGGGGEGRGGEGEVSYSWFQCYDQS